MAHLVRWITHSKWWFSKIAMLNYHKNNAQSSTALKKCGYGSIPIDTFLVGWTSIYQLFWGSLGTRVLTHPHVSRSANESMNPTGVLIRLRRATESLGEQKFSLKSNMQNFKRCGVWKMVKWY
jgi:hypothetical protein